MSMWMIWILLAGALLILEMFSGTFYLLMLALGAAAGGVASWLGLGMPLQYGAAAMVGIVAILILRRSKLVKSGSPEAANDPNINIDIGQTITVDTWVTPIDGVATARVSYRGAMWDVNLAPGSHPVPGQFTIASLLGSRLVVRKSH